MDYTADFLPWLRANIARWGKSREYIETYLDWYELQKLHVSDPMCLGSLAEACNLPGHPMAHERRLIPVAMGMKKSFEIFAGKRANGGNTSKPPTSRRLPTGRLGGRPIQLSDVELNRRFRDWFEHAPKLVVSTVDQWAAMSTVERASAWVKQRRLAKMPKRRFRSNNEVL